MGRLLFATLPGAILGALMLAGIAINFANVVSRHVFGQAIFWTEEVLVFITIWSVFLGMVRIAYNGEHLNMDLFSAQVRGPWRTVLNGATVALMLAVCAFVAVQSWTTVALFARAGQVSVAAGIPKAIPHSALLVGFVLTAAAVVVRIRSYLSGRF
jgi:TRAP-type C4-dicarboxylate transport system permease small subunit